MWSVASSAKKFLGEAKVTNSGLAKYTYISNLSMSLTYSLRSQIFKKLSTGTLSIIRNEASKSYRKITLQCTIINYTIAMYSM